LSISDLRFPSFEERKYFAGPRMAIQLGFLENRLTIAMNLKATAARRHQRHCGILELSLDFGRQTDGPRFVVSKRAVLDRDRHRPLGDGKVYRDGMGRPARFARFRMIVSCLATTVRRESKVL
jgi:hypothetical protein